MITLTKTCYKIVCSVSGAWVSISNSGKLLVKLLVIASTLSAMVPANAAGAWYRGEIKRIYLFGSGFVLTFKNDVLDDCKHTYVYFKTSVISERAVDSAYAMALSAQAQGKAVGVVIDKAINGPDGYCNGNGSIDLND